MHFFSPSCIITSKTFSSQCSTQANGPWVKRETPAAFKIEKKSLSQYVYGFSVCQAPTDIEHISEITPIDQKIMDIVWVYTEKPLLLSFLPKKTAVLGVDRMSGRKVMEVFFHRLWKKISKSAGLLSTYRFSDKLSFGSERECTVIHGTLLSKPLVVSYPFGLFHSPRDQYVYTHTSLKPSLYEKKLPY